MSDARLMQAISYTLGVSVSLDDIAKVRAAIHAAGFAVVPVEPTEAMLDAGEEDEQGWRRMPYPRVRLKLHWEAMIAAAKETGDEG
jgi:hypothetical protein